jgi:hypothetical protein
MKRLTPLLIAALLNCAPALAAGPGYRIDCLPDGGGLSLAENLKMRLELHGWHEATDRPDYHVCLKLQQRQQIVPDGAGPGYGPYWGPPTYHVVEVPYLELAVTGKEGENWNGRQDLPDGDSQAQRVEEGTRALIDRLPW